MIDRFWSFSCLNYMDHVWAGDKPWGRCRFCDEVWGPVKHVVNECTSAKILAAREDAIKELDTVGVTSKDHLFNILFRRVGVKEFLWRKVAHIGAQFLIKSDILGNF